MELPRDVDTYLVGASTSYILLSVKVVHMCAIKTSNALDRQAGKVMYDQSLAKKTVDQL
jgi:hypothetical protein